MVMRNMNERETEDAIVAFNQYFRCVDPTKAKAEVIKPFKARDPEDIPPREWLYGDHLIRGFVSLTVAPGGVGKSSLLLTEVISMTTNIDLLGYQPIRPLKVWYHGGEDPIEETERRLAAIFLHYDFSKEHINQKLFLTSGRDFPLMIAKMERGVPIIVENTINQIRQNIISYQIDVLVIDPFVTCHQIEENDTGGMNLVISAFRKIADATGCAVELVHHTSKAGARAGQDFGIYASRGAGALIDGVRSARSLVRMTEAEAKQFGISERERHTIFSVSFGKPNMAPIGDMRWLQTVGVDLKNGRSFWDRGDTVAVVKVWTPPKADPKISEHAWPKVHDALMQLSQPPTRNERGKRWAGYIVADVLGIDVGPVGSAKAERTPDQNTNRRKVTFLIGDWIQKRLLVVEEIDDGRSGRSVEVIKVGPDTVFPHSE